MVDFQARDTRRGESTDDPDSVGEPEEPGTESADASEEPQERDGRDGLGFAIVTVGTERTIEDDDAGNAVVDALGGAGVVVTREVIDNRYDGIQRAVGSLVERGDVEVVVSVGGTGVEPSDVTIEAVEPMLDKHLPGVGELIRRHCADERGTAAVRTRTTGGVIAGVPLFCLPGDPELAGLATRELVVREAEPLAELARETAD